ncbi:MAG: cobalamin-dependent protein [Chloroflexota bacterium]|nr:cobalamin-dependent protein [Chloroflexota bacterium]
MVATETLRPLEYSDTPIYNTKAVSIRTSVPADTLRAWERRYGVPKPHRTAGAQRLYSERDIAAIRWLKQRTETGLSIKQAVALLKATMEEEAAEQPAPVPQPETTDTAAEALLNALQSLDSVQADRVLAQSFARYGIETTCLNIIQPAMYRIGEAWAAGRIPVSVEHYASYLVRSKLTGLVSAYGQSGTVGPIITACAPGEQHELGLLMFALFLMRRGLKVIYLGADLPAGDLVAMIERTRPKVVCLSAATTKTAESLVGTISMIKRVGGRVPEVTYGGFAFTHEPDLRDRVDGFWLGEDAVRAAETVRQLALQLN